LSKTSASETLEELKQRYNEIVIEEWQARISGKDEEYRSFGWNAAMSNMLSTIHKEDPDWSSDI
jgi:hypothetical protein